MGVSTGKGDDGYTGTLAGERVPKYHMVTEAVGTNDEANALLGLARASSRERRTKRILLQVQKHLFIIGAELSSHNKRQTRKKIADKDVNWVDKVLEDMEEALSLPPGFVAFGQDTCSAHMDVARTAVRKTERIVARMQSEGLLDNQFLLKYLNRLSDLIFVLACFEERSESERRKINRSLFYAHWADPSVWKVSLIAGAAILVLSLAIVLLLIFHKPAPQTGNPAGHMPAMDGMHR